MQTLLNLVSAANVYRTSQSRSDINVAVLQAVSQWVARMLRMFGLGEGADVDSRGKPVVGWGQARQGGENGAVEDVSGGLSYMAPHTTRLLAASITDGMLSLPVVLSFPKHVAKTARSHRHALRPCSV